MPLFFFPIPFLNMDVSFKETASRDQEFTLLEYLRIAENAVWTHQEEAAHIPIFLKIYRLLPRNAIASMVIRSRNLYCTLLVSILLFLSMVAKGRYDQGSGSRCNFGPPINFASACFHMLPQNDREMARPGPEQCSWDNL